MSRVRVAGFFGIIVTVLLLAWPAAAQVPPEVCGPVGSSPAGAPPACEAPSTTTTTTTVATTVPEPSSTPPAEAPGPAPGADAPTTPTIDAGPPPLDPPAPPAEVTTTTAIAPGPTSRLTVAASPVSASLRDADHGPAPWRKPVAIIGLVALLLLVGASNALETKRSGAAG